MTKTPYSSLFFREKSVKLQPHCTNPAYPAFAYPNKNTININSK